MRKYFTTLDHENEIYCYNQMETDNFHFLVNKDFIGYGGFGIVTRV